MLTITELGSIDCCKSIKDLWEELSKDINYPTPFLNYHWFACCIHHYQKGKKLLILLVKDGNDLIGIAPLWRYKDKFRGIPFRKIEFITCPDSHLVDFVIRCDRRKEVLKSIFLYLFKDKKDTWDVLVFNQWPKKSLNFESVLKILIEKNKKYFIRVTSKTPCIDIKGGWEEYLQNQSTRFRKTHRNIANRVNKLKTAEVHCYRDGNKNLLKDILHISRRSWKENEGISISSKNESILFFKALSHIAGQKGWLSVWMLKVDSHPIAMEYDLVFDRKVYALRADYDETYKKYSPGSYLEYQIIKHLFQERYLEYNSGPGMNVYKLRWTDKAKENIALHICNDSLKGRAIWELEEKLVPFMKRIRASRTNVK